RALPSKLQTSYKVMQMQNPSSRTRNVGSRRLSWAVKKIFGFSLLITIFGALMWIHHEALLQYAAEQWVVSDTIQPADAVVVLGGGIDTRPFAAAEDYRKGLARKILVTNVLPSRAEALGVSPSHAAINRGVLIKLGVQETDIEALGIALSTTYDE